MENIINNIEGILQLAGFGLASILLGFVFYKFMKLLYKIAKPVLGFLFDVALLVLFIVLLITPDACPIYDEVIIGGTSYYRWHRYFIW